MCCCSLTCLLPLAELTLLACRLPLRSPARDPHPRPPLRLGEPPCLPRQHPRSVQPLAPSRVPPLTRLAGWETTTVVPWSEVTAIEKGKTALVLPNAIEISTLNAKHSFASLLSRDATYALLVTVWRHAHPEEARDDSRSALSDEMSYEDDTGEKKRFKFRPRLPAILRRRDSSSSASSGGEGLTEAQKVVKATRRGHPETKYEGEEYANVAGEFELPTSPETAYGLMFRDEEFLKSFWAENQKLKGEFFSLRFGNEADGK